LGELANNNEARAIEGRSGKLGKRAGKVNILTWGDLLSGYRSSNLVRLKPAASPASSDAVDKAGFNRSINHSCFNNLMTHVDQLAYTHLLAD
jgi:hypothetical protein